MQTSLTSRVARWRTLALGLCFVSVTTAASAAIPMPTNTGGAYTVQVTSWRDLPFRTVVRQQFDYSCGSAALATLLHFHYDQPVREAEIFTAMYKAGDQDKIRKVGFSLLDMKRYLASAGYSSDGYRVTLDNFAKLNTPGIALVKTGAYRHFVVVKGVAGDRVLVGDPALGLKVYSRREFQQMWSGIMFVIDDQHVGRFNLKQEWAQRGLPGINPYLADTQPGQLMRDLPTLYQITSVFAIPGRSEP
jgi:predicted double-glycine peptidase